MRSKSRKLVNDKSQDGILNSSRKSDFSQMYQLEKIPQKQSQTNVVHARKQSHTHFEKNPSTEFQQKNEEHLKEMEKPLKKNFCNDSTCKYSTAPVSVCCNIPTEAEIQKIIDEFNILFRQYNEIIAKAPKENVKNTQSTVKFSASKQDQNTINVGVMTEHENRDVVSYKLNSKIRKCQCSGSKKEIRRHSSSQSVKTVKSCSCNFRKSKSDIGMRKNSSLKSINNSNYFVQSPRYSKHHINSKPNWISKTMRKFRSKDDRK